MYMTLKTLMILSLALSSELVCGSSASAQSHTTPKQSDLTYRVEVLTDLPVQVGVGGLVEWNKTWRLQSSLGWMPSAYVNGTNRVVRMIIPESYSEETAQLVEDTIRDSLVWSLRAGWRPLRERGLYAHLGYSLITIGGGSTASGLIEGITGVEISRMTNPDRGELPISAAATLHLASLEVGWEWSLLELARERALTLRAALGFSYTFTSSATLKVERESNRPAVRDAYRRLEDAGEDYLTDTFETYIHPPSLTIALGYTW